MDPMMFKALGEEHLDELRREAAAHRAARSARPPFVAQLPRWRRTTGHLLVGAGRRMLREDALVVVIRGRE